MDSSEEPFIMVLAPQSTQPFLIMCFCVYLLKTDYEVMSVTMNQWQALAFSPAEPPEG